VLPKPNALGVGVEVFPKADCVVAPFPLEAAVVPNDEELLPNEKEGVPVDAEAAVVGVAAPPNEKAGLEGSDGLLPAVALLALLPNARGLLGAEAAPRELPVTETLPPPKPVNPPLDAEAEVGVDAAPLVEPKTGDAPPGPLKLNLRADAGSAGSAVFGAADEKLKVEAWGLGVSLGTSDAVFGEGVLVTPKLNLGAARLEACELLGLKAGAVLVPADDTDGATADPKAEVGCEDPNGDGDLVCPSLVAVDEPNAEVIFGGSIFACVDANGEPSLEGGLKLFAILLGEGALTPNETGAIGEFPIVLLIVDT